MYYSFLLPQLWYKNVLIISYKDGVLYYNRDDNAPKPLVPLADDMFFMEDVPFFRIKMDTKDGQVQGIKGLYDNGHEDYSPLDRV